MRLLMPKYVTLRAVVKVAFFLYLLISADLEARILVGKSKKGSPVSRYMRVEKDGNEGDKETVRYYHDVK